jgi:hypothetical protein
MELSPLAKARLAKIGELSTEEKNRLKLSEELTAILADYFTGRINPEELQNRIKSSSNKESIAREIQVRLAQAINLGSGEIDFNRNRDGILSCEKLKKNARSAEIEKQLGSVKSLREKFQKENESFLQSLKDTVRKQVTQTIQRMASQGRQSPIDIESSIEASAKSSPQWREFIIKQENTYNQMFSDVIAKMNLLF